MIPVDYPNTNGNGYWFRKMTGSAVTRTSDNSTDATEQCLSSCLIPAGIVQPNSIIKIWCYWSFSNNSSTGTTKNFAIRMDANPLSSPVSGATAIITSTATTNLTACQTSQFWFNNSVASQVILNSNGALGGIFSSNAERTTSVDFSVDRNICFNTNWSVNQAVSQTIKLAGWTVEVLR